MADTKQTQIFSEKYDAENASNEKPASFSSAPTIPQYTKAETAKILWKIDWRLVPFLSVLYLYDHHRRLNQS
jgi:hypothetical protein